MSPFLKASIIFYYFLPSELTCFILFKKAFEIDSVHIAQKLVVVLASSNDIEVGANKGSAMESSLFWTIIIIAELNFCPSACLNIKGPAVIEVHV